MPCSCRHAGCKRSVGHVRGKLDPCLGHTSLALVCPACFSRPPGRASPPASAEDLFSSPGCARCRGLPSLLLTWAQRAAVQRFSSWYGPAHSCPQMLLVALTCTASEHGSSTLCAPVSSSPNSGVSLAGSGGGVQPPEGPEAREYPCAPAPLPGPITPSHPGLYRE